MAIVDYDNVAEQGAFSDGLGNASDGLGNTADGNQIPGVNVPLLPTTAVGGLSTFVTDVTSGITGGLRDWTTNIIFSSTAYNDLAWTAGTINLSNGLSYSISSGSLVLTSTHYIFLDTAVSTTVLQSTTTQANSVGNTRLIIALAKINADTTLKATIKTFGGQGDSVLIETLNIAASAVTTAKIAVNAIDATLIAAGAVGSSELAAGAVIAGKITAGSIVSADIAAGTIVASNIAAGTITSNEIAANTITANDIAAGTITANEIAGNTITAAKIAAGTITATEIAAGTITGSKISSATTITAGSGTDVAALDGADSTWRIYAGHSTPASAPFRVDKSGNVTMTSATISGYTVSSTGTFGGDGSDGAVTDANLTITGSNNTLITKQYSSWAAGTSARTFTVTPTGCILYIKISGDANFTNWTFTFDGKGTVGGTSGSSSGGTTAMFGVTGGARSGNSGQGGGGGASSVANGSTGTPSSPGGAGGTGVSPFFSANQLPLLKSLKVDCGSGGGAGNEGGVTTGDGGAGGGCVIMEVAGDLNLGSATFNFNGSNGTSAGTVGAGGGGGGGTFLLLYNGTLTGTSTNNANGGTGASLGGATGGNGATGLISITKNTVFG